MLATQGTFKADETQVFKLDDFIRDFKLQHDAHCEKMGISIQHEIGLKRLKATPSHPYLHYKISYGEQFTQDLKKFFEDKSVPVHNCTTNAFIIYKHELDAVKITCKAAGEFFFNLNQSIRNIQRAAAEQPVSAPTLRA